MDPQSRPQCKEPEQVHPRSQGPNGRGETPVPYHAPMRADSARVEHVKSEAPKIAATVRRRAHK